MAAARSPRSGADDWQRQIEDPSGPKPCGWMHTCAQRLGSAARGQARLYIHNRRLPCLLLRQRRLKHAAALVGPKELDTVQQLLPTIPGASLGLHAGGGYPHRHLSPSVVML